MGGANSINNLKNIARGAARLPGVAPVPKSCNLEQQEKVMKPLMFLCALLYAVGFFVVASPAYATNSQSFVASSGSDSNACTQAAPCLTFGHAIGQTSAGGEIDCLSGGNFGPVTITQSITIDCGEGQAGTASSNGEASITLNTSSSTVIIIRNLNLNGFGAPSYGIDTQSFPGGTLIIQHCTIKNFGGYGINFAPSSGRGVMQISDTAISNNQYGVLVNPASNVIASVVFDRVEITGSAGGGAAAIAFEGNGTIAGTLRQSLIAENGSYGVYTSAAAVYFTVEETSIVDNLVYGIVSLSSGTNFEVGASTIGGNGTGVSAQSGTIYTFGNNQISANGSNGSFTPGGPGLE
jgi:hypothetical protein